MWKLILVIMSLISTPIAFANDGSHDAYCPNATVITLQAGQTYTAPNIASPALHGSYDATNEAEWQFFTQNTSGKLGSITFEIGVSNPSQFSCPMSPWNGDVYLDPYTASGQLYPDNTADLIPSLGFDGKGFRQFWHMHRRDNIDPTEGCFINSGESIASWLVVGAPQLSAWVKYNGPIGASINIIGPCVDGEANSLLNY